MRDASKVGMEDFELLKVLGTGGKFDTTVYVRAVCCTVYVLCMYCVTHHHK